MKWVSFALTIIFINAIQLLILSPAILAGRDVTALWVGMGFVWFGGSILMVYQHINR